MHWHSDDYDWPLCGVETGPLQGTEAEGVSTWGRLGRISNQVYGKRQKERPFLEF